MKTLDVRRCCISASDSLRHAAGCIDATGRGIALVVDGDSRLLGTVTDGDIRRALLHGMSLDHPVSQLLERKTGSTYSQPFTAPVGTDPVELLRLMRESGVHQVPLHAADATVVDLVILDDLLPTQLLPLQGLIMAGGYGKRLSPLTDNLPKPMLPVEERPLLERLVEQLRQAGIRRISVSTHHAAEKITSHFGDGLAFGVEMSYVTEDSPLGTAGALGLMEPPTEPLLVVNGDILTRLDFRAMLAYHREHRADLTVALRDHSVQVPFGVVECEGPHIRRLREKPVVNVLVNAGIYLLEPSAHRFIVAGERLDMTDLIGRLVDAGRAVVGFPVFEYWLDVGEPASYRRAQEDVVLW